MTLDYGTQADGGLDMACRCGAVQCRKRITGSDWQIPELQVRYGDHWVPVLLSRIGGR